MLIDDETALAWGPKVTAAKDMSLTPVEAEQRWREQLQLEAKRRADNYAAADSEYQNKKSEAALLQQNGTAANGQGRNSSRQGISGISQEVPDRAIAVNITSISFALSEQTIVSGRRQSVRPGDE